MAKKRHRSQQLLNKTTTEGWIREKYLEYRFLQVAIRNGGTTIIKENWTKTLKNTTVNNYHDPQNSVSKLK